MFMILLFASCGNQENDQLFVFPDHAKPEFIGKLAAENLLTRKYMMRAMDPGIHYAEICTADGAIRFAGLTQDSSLMSRLRDRYSCFIDSADCSLMPSPQIRYTAAMNILSMYHFNQETEYLERTLELVQEKWERRANTEIDPATGLPTHTRFWADDMYFTPALDSRIYSITGDVNCTNRVTKLLRAYVDTLQLPNGLFKHTTKVDFIWGRGVGWAAAGLKEALLALPECHPDFQYLMNAYRALMTGLLPYQTENGLWRQLIDHPTAWEETSGTGIPRKEKGNRGFPWAGSPVMGSECSFAGIR
jgi:rhamnogalacturonyl hydrolase YesR